MASFALHRLFDNGSQRAESEILGFSQSGVGGGAYASSIAAVAPLGRAAALLQSLDQSQRCELALARLSSDSRF